MKLKRKCECVLAKNDSYEMVLVIECNLLVEWFLWVFATTATAGLFYLYASIVQPKITDGIITFLFG